MTVTGPLFKVLYECLNDVLGTDGLGVTVLQNESVAKASSQLHSAVEVSDTCKP